MNPRYQDFLDDLRRENLVEELVPETENTADSLEAVKVFGDEFVMVTADSPGGYAPGPGPDVVVAGRECVEIHESKPPDMKALHKFLDAHEGLRAAFPAQQSDGAAEAFASREFAFRGLGRDSALIRHQLKKKAVDEVNGLHMVDHVLCAAEREQKKIVSHPHDGLHVKQALHDFLQALSSEDLNAISIAETMFLEETEKWVWDLIDKDSKLSVADLRRYFESAKPALSSRALTSLARFYRNAPFSYAVREKFELVMTRLLTRETVGDKRKSLFTRDLMSQQIGAMYAEWASLQTYSESDSFEVGESASMLERFMHDAEQAESFEELISDEFFARLRAFKENLHEEFFSPFVTASAVECNVVVGNRFIDLLEQERKRESIEGLAEKFPDACSEDVSEVTAKTIGLEEKMCGPKRKSARLQRKAPTLVPVKKKGSFAKKLKSALSIGPWLAVVIAVIVLSSVAIYYGAQRMIFESGPSTQVRRVNLENSALKEYILGATLSGETFLGTVTPAWDLLDEGQKEETMKRLLSIGGSNGFRYVRLIDAAGNTVASATPDRIDIR